MVLPKRELDCIEAELNASVAEIPEMERTLNTAMTRLSIALHRFVWTVAESLPIVRDIAHKANNVTP